MPWIHRTCYATASCRLYPGCGNQDHRDPSKGSYQHGVLRAGFVDFHHFPPTHSSRMASSCAAAYSTGARPGLLKDANLAACVRMCRTLMQNVSSTIQQRVVDAITPAFLDIHPPQPTTLPLVTAVIDSANSDVKLPQLSFEISKMIRLAQSNNECGAVANPTEMALVQLTDQETVSGEYRKEASMTAAVIEVPNVAWRPVQKVELPDDEFTPSPATPNDAGTMGGVGVDGLIDMSANNSVPSTSQALMPRRDFKSLWRKFSSLGWKKRAPRGRRTITVFVAPGRSGRLTRLTSGVHYFEGQDALLGYARSQGLLEAAIGLDCSIQPARVDTTEASLAEPTCEEAEIANPCENDALSLHTFLEEMFDEPMHRRVDSDDINLISDVLEAGYGADELAETEVNDANPDQWDFVEDVDSSGSESEEEAQTFDVPDEVLRSVGNSGWNVFSEENAGNLVIDRASDLYNGPWGPTISAAALADSPLRFFFYLLPKSMWVDIAAETNRYRSQCLPAMAEEKRNRLLGAQQKDPTISVSSLEAIQTELTRHKPFHPVEIAHLIGLLIARALCPMRDGIATHWACSEDGALPRETWGRYMTRARYVEITRFLHFCDNTSDEALHDKARKIRPILQVIETTFRRGYRLGAMISFDEGMIPNKSKYNPIRVYNKEKPNTWGTKFYLTCCPKTAYCARVEVYCGKEKVAKGNVGPTAVVQNISKALHGQPAKRIIITDNIYSSVALSLKLLSMGLYHVGMVRTNRLGWCKEIQYTHKKRPQSIKRGTYRIARCRDYPELVALSWMDSRPVNMLATGCSTVPTNVQRREKDGSKSTVPCPSIIPEYLAGVGGVGVHDQIRLQGYSVQKTVALRKYYKQLFFGLVGMAIANGFIVYNFMKKKNHQKTSTHARYMRQLHKDLLGLQAKDLEENMFGEDIVSAPVITDQHRVEKVAENFQAKTNVANSCVKYAH